ncbi:hypothetical protein [Schaalia sp. JY-X159]|uniref:hypothetical protein n=1 Tax=Schaalia sp. JY-X159 TaxID=2758575 RepID=UPI00165E26F5|nr:hypothetical protein [Schaalia sp. JY-X159]
MSEASYGGAFPYFATGGHIADSTQLFSKPESRSNLRTREFSPIVRISDSLNPSGLDA